MAGVSIALCLTALVACAGEPDRGSAPAPSGTGSAEGPGSLAPLTAPPTDVPHAELQSRSIRQPGSLLAYRWVTRTGRVADTTPHEPVAWPDPVDRLDVSAATAILDTAVMPVRVEFRSYDSVDKRTGVPTTISDPRVCQTQIVNGQTCLVQVLRDDIVVTVPPDVARFVVLYAEWYVPVALRTDRNVSTYSASWAFHLR
jgi:hypothetical protein